MRSTQASKMPVDELDHPRSQHEQPFVLKSVARPDVPDSYVLRVTNAGTAPK